MVAGFDMSGYEGVFIAAALALFLLGVVAVIAVAGVMTWIVKAVWTAAIRRP